MTPGCERTKREIGFSLENSNEFYFSTYILCALTLYDYSSSDPELAEPILVKVLQLRVQTFIISAYNVITSR
jgi:hypothetical protein